MALKQGCSTWHSDLWRQISLCFEDLPCAWQGIHQYAGPVFTGCHYCPRKTSKNISRLSHFLRIHCSRSFHSTEMRITKCVPVPLLPSPTPPNTSVLSPLPLGSIPSGFVLCHKQQEPVGSDKHRMNEVTGRDTGQRSALCIRALGTCGLFWQNTIS